MDIFWQGSKINQLYLGIGHLILNQIYQMQVMGLMEHKTVQQATEAFINRLKKPGNLMPLDDRIYRENKT